jgi:hypothetical protein
MDSNETEARNDHAGEGRQQFDRPSRLKPGMTVLAKTSSYLIAWPNEASQLTVSRGQS